MLKRHEDAIMERFDALTNVGWTSIHWWELNTWYGMQRLTKRVYRDLRDRFHEENEGELYIHMSHDALLLIHNRGFFTMSEKLGEVSEADEDAE